MSGLLKVKLLLMQLEGKLHQKSGSNVFRGKQRTNKVPSKTFRRLKVRKKLRLIKDSMKAKRQHER